jgi:hypothetical protein
MKRSRIVPTYTEAGKFEEANVITITDGQRYALYTALQIIEGQELEPLLARAQRWDLTTRCSISHALGSRGRGDPSDSLHCSQLNWRASPNRLRATRARASLPTAPQLGCRGAVHISP